MDHKIENLKIYIEKETQEILSASAEINGVFRYTSDIRNEKFINDTYAVFSEKDKNEIYFESTKKCLEYGIYEEREVSYSEVISDFYIYVTLKL